MSHDDIDNGQASPGSATGGTTADLKGRFAAGSIPVDTDFSAVIDIAECGRRAVGQSADQTDNTVGVGLQLAADSDAANKGKLSVKAGTGIVVDGKGVSVDPAAIFVKGMIMMFSGTTAPVGWAFCDGSTAQGSDGQPVQLPDLRNRFVLGADMAAETLGRSDGTVSWDSNSKAYNTITTKAAPSGISINSHTLGVENLPPHSHPFIDRYEEEVYLQAMNLEKGSGSGAAPSVLRTTDGTQWSMKIDDTGSGTAIGHSLASDSHSHGVDVRIPYYTIAFIMKL